MTNYKRKQLFKKSMRNPYDFILIENIDLRRGYPEIRPMNFRIATFNKTTLNFYDMSNRIFIENLYINMPQYKKIHQQICKEREWLKT